MLQASDLFGARMADAGKARSSSGAVVMPLSWQLPSGALQHWPGRVACPEDLGSAMTLRIGFAVWPSRDAWLLSLGSALMVVSAIPEQGVSSKAQGWRVDIPISKGFS